ncbi:MAG: signal peptidase II [archaeon]
MVDWKRPAIILTAAAVVILDQVTKHYAKNMEPKNLFSFLWLRLTTNTGSGFGLFQDKTVPLIILSFAAIGIIIYYFFRIQDDMIGTVLLGLLLGGTVGNLIDRIAYGYVIDFIDFSFWPSFNIADSALSVGAIGIMLYYWKK